MANGSTQEFLIIPKRSKKGEDDITLILIDADNGRAYKKDVTIIIDSMAEKDTEEDDEADSPGKIFTSGESYWIYIIILAIVILLMILYLFYSKPKKEEKEEERGRGREEESTSVGEEEPSPEETGVEGEPAMAIEEPKLPVPVPIPAPAEIPQLPAGIEEGSIEEEMGRGIESETEAETEAEGLPTILGIGAEDTEESEDAKDVRDSKDAEDTAGNEERATGS
jgi:hypothetical protein